LLRKRVPKVANTFDRLDLNSSLITVQWFVCMYAFTFSSEVVACIWDEIFAFGHNVIYKYSLAIF
jgi:GTPase-activating protein